MTTDWIEERDDQCQDALKPELARIVREAERFGWYRAEVQVALLSLVMYDVRQTEGVEAARMLLHGSLEVLGDELVASEDS